MVQGAYDCGAGRPRAVLYVPTLHGVQVEIELAATVTLYVPAPQLTQGEEIAPSAVP